MHPYSDRGDTGPKVPFSTFDSYYPEDLWTYQEVHRNMGIESLAIPHNSNLSAGAMFLLPESLDEARIRRELEPLVELLQIKGSSECRWEARKGDMWGTTDEECSFELQNFNTIGDGWIPAAQRNARTIQPSNFVRNTLKSGLQYG